MNIDRHELRLVIDPAGHPLAGSATTVMRSGGFLTVPMEFGPFDTVEDATAALYARVDIQLTLW